LELFAHFGDLCPNFSLLQSRTQFVSYIVKGIQFLPDVAED